jgi:hypothetical protein
MLSHDFAHALLKRRNHDLRFLVDASLPGHDDDDRAYSVQLADDRHREVGTAGDPPEVLRYDSEEDFLEVRLGQIFLGRQGSYTLTPEEALYALSALDKKIWAWEHNGVPKSDPRVEPFVNLRKAIKQELG